VAYTTADLINNVKRRSFLPVAQTQFTDQQILNIGDDVVLSQIAPMLRRMDQGYWLESYDQTLTSGTSAYAFPAHAMWNKVNVVQLVTTAGVVVSELTRIQPQTLSLAADTTTGQPSYFYFTHDKIVLHPAPSASVASTMYLREWIYRRPNRMVVTTDAGQISSKPSSTQIQFLDAPSTRFQDNDGLNFDAFSSNSPFVRVVTASTGSVTAPKDMTFSSADVALMSVGDFVCIEDETVFPPVPIEIVPHLESLIVLELQATQMDREAMAETKEAIMQEIESVMRGAGNRADEQAKKVSLFNSPLASMLGRRGRRLVRS